MGAVETKLTKQSSSSQNECDNQLEIEVYDNSAQILYIYWEDSLI